METKQFKKSEIGKWQRWKWVLEDMAGLYTHKIIATLSSDPEIKQLFQEMKIALLQEGNQPKATQISEEIRGKIMENSQKRLN